jgi:Zn-dependent protease
VDALLFRSLKIGRIAEIDIFLHWTMWLFPVFVLMRGFVLYSSDETLMQTLLVLGVYGCLLIHEFGHILTARLVGPRLRDVTLFPIGGYDRLAELSERPWKEIPFAVVGPLLHALIAGVIAVVLLACECTLMPRLESPQPCVEVYFNRLFWLNVLLAICQVIPAFPMDGGRLFRGALALSAGRLRATEVAALLSSFVALVFVVSGIIWVSVVWWLIALGVIVYVSGQQELLRVRFFTYLQEPTTQFAGRAPIHVPMDRVFDDEGKRVEADFTGLTWSAKDHLWIVWRDGVAMSANALVGE